VDKFSPYFVRSFPIPTWKRWLPRDTFKKGSKSKRFYHRPDYDFGRREEAAFAQEIKRLVPDAEIVYEAWPKLGEKDFTAFITAIMAKKPDAVHGSLFGGDLVSFTKQAAPYGFFERTPFIALYDFPVLLALGLMHRSVRV
jgi:branched-chain amino acid transport system substrate-binding protein